MFLVLSILLFLIFALAIVFVVLYFLKDCQKPSLAVSYLSAMKKTTAGPDSRAANGDGFSILGIHKPKKELIFSLFIGQPLSSPITMAHIHVQNEDGTLGDAVVPLVDFMTQPREIARSFLVKNMKIKSSDFIGPLKDKSFETFFKLLSEGKLWVNVHSVFYPKGEIYGPLALLSK